MTKYCNNEKLRKWALGETDCNGDHKKCRRVVTIGTQQYCGYCPVRTALHQIVKSQAGCTFCIYYTKDLNSAKCLPCLSQEKRINFKREEK